MPGDTHVPSGFFVLRTPLLPFDTLHGERCGSTDAVENVAAGTPFASLLRARAIGRARLLALIERPEVLEAMFVASPSLVEAITRWIRDPEDARVASVATAVFRYLSRMTFRPTPFGLCSGCSVGHLVEDSTRAVLVPLAEYRRHTQLDMHYLAGLAASRGTELAMRTNALLRPNSSLYASGGKLRYAEGVIDPETETLTYRVVAVERTEYLDLCLSRAASGFGAGRLAESLCTDQPTLSSEAAQAFVASLIDSRLLVPDLAPTISGPEPADGFLGALVDRSGASEGIARELADATAACRALDATPIGHPPARYREIAAGLAAGSSAPDIARLFHVDLYKGAPNAALGPAAMELLTEAIALLTRLAVRSSDTTMAAFRRSFVARYGDIHYGPVGERTLIPLTEALDDEAGIGFPGAVVSAVDPSPLLDGIVFPADALSAGIPFGAREDRLLRGMSGAIGRGDVEWRLDDDDLDMLSLKPMAALPDAFAFMGVLAARSTEELDRGNGRVLADSISGPSGARLLGRFCHGDPELRRAVVAHLRAEEALHPDAVFAEIVHLPEGRLGNILARPALRAYEIPYLGHASTAVELQISIQDLYLTMLDGRLALYSKRLEREVVPRLTSAHNFGSSHLPIYRFLCAMQDGEQYSFAWSWGPLANAPFLPRVVRGRVILALARWNLAKREISPLARGTPDEQFVAMQKLRADRDLPRWVALVDGDNVLTVDLDNVIAVESLVSLIARRETAILTEVFPSADELIVEGPEGKFTHEIIVPYVRKAPAARAATAAPAPSVSHQRQLAPVERTFPPGSEWLFAKLYGGPISVDAVLKEIVTPLVAEQQPATWFFIRYADPDWHLRLRLRGDASALLSRAVPDLHSRLAPFLADGRIRKVQLDTYEREVERYGGPEAIAIAESLFEADSEAAVAMLSLLEPEEEADARWRLALRGMHALLLDLGLDLGQRLGVMSRVRDAFAKEHRLDVNLGRQIGAKYRAERLSLEALLHTPAGADHPLDPGFAIFGDRSAKSAPFVSTLRALEAGRRLTIPIVELAPSFLHMHANRMLRSEQRAQELVLYDFLMRLYESEVARGRGRGGEKKP